MEDTWPAFFTADNSTVMFYDDIHADGHHRYILILLSLVSLFGTSGNLLVITSVVFIRKLRKPCNYLFASLAIADLLVCVILMPTALTNLILEVQDGKWSFGYSFCKAFICIDVVLTTATIWNLSLIAMDRFLAIKRPLWYARYRNGKMAIRAVSLTWSVSVFLSLPVIFFPAGQDLGSDESDGFICMPKENIFFVVAAVISFYIPCIMLVLLYSFVYRANRKLMTCKDQNYQQSRSKTAQACVYAMLPATAGTASSDNNPKTKDRNTSGTGGIETTGTTQPISEVMKVVLVGLKSDSKPSLRRVKLHSKLRQQRASRILAAIITAFICCWFPFFCFLTVHGIGLALSTYYINPIVFHVVHWCGWCNSIFNPLLYASLKGDFQDAFKKIFRRKNARQNRP